MSLQKAKISEYPMSPMGLKIPSQFQRAIVYQLKKRGPHKWSMKLQEVQIALKTTQG